MKILIGALIGIALGIAFGPKVAVLKPIGDIFIRLLQMIIVPLTFLSIVSGITATILLSTLGLPLTIIPIIAAVSPLVDMGHTVVNITGDLVGAQVVNENIASSEEKNVGKGEKIC